MAFESLTERLQNVFKNLRKKGKISEADVQEATKEIRLALLEADVALPVVKDFIKRVRERAVGHEVIETLNPAQQIVKIVDEELTAILAVFIFPVLGHVWHMSNFQFGLWSGTAINDTSSVVAAAFSYSKAAGEMATIVKLTRALMIVPVCLGLIGLKWYRSKQQGRNKGMLKKIIPWFIIWFIVASILSSIGLVPKVVLPYLKDLSHLFMAMALVGIGSKVSWKQFRAAGAAPLLVGVIGWFCVAGSSLILQMLFY